MELFFFKIQSERAYYYQLLMSSANDFKQIPVFLTWKIFVIFQVVVVERFHFITTLPPHPFTPSLPVRHLEPGVGGGGGQFHMKRQGILVGIFKLNS